MLRNRERAEAPRILILALALCLAVMLAGGPEATAAPSGTSIEKKIEKQSRQIDLKRDKGTLTDYEAAVLRDNLNFIRDTDAQMRRDGKLSKKEREQLKDMLDRNDKMLNRKKYHPVTRIY